MRDEIEKLLLRFETLLKRDKKRYEKTRDRDKKFFLAGTMVVLELITAQLQDLINDNPIQTNCKECEGTGQGKQITFTNSKSINPPEYADCTECNGSGLVEVQ